MSAMAAKKTDKQVASEAKDRTERESAKPDDSPGFESDTPSGVALAKVGEDADGEAYQAAKKKQRWG